MKRLKYWLLHSFLPLMALLIVFSGSGSLTTRATVSTETALAPQVGEKYLQAFCDRYWGFMSEDGIRCEFEQTFHMDLTHVGEDSVLSQIALVPGDNVSIVAASAPEAIVGPTNYAATSERFTVDKPGYLALRATPRLKAFSVQKIQVYRCFGILDGAISTVACPEGD